MGFNAAERGKRSDHRPGTLPAVVGAGEVVPFGGRGQLDHVVAEDQRRLGERLTAAITTTLQLPDARVVQYTKGWQYPYGQGRFVAVKSANKKKRGFLWKYHSTQASSGGEDNSVTVTMLDTEAKQVTVVSLTRHSFDFGIPDLDAVHGFVYEADEKFVNTWERTGGASWRFVRDQGALPPGHPQSIDSPDRVVELVDFLDDAQPDSDATNAALSYSQLALRATPVPKEIKA